MAEPITPLPLTSWRADQIFPTLTSVQIARVATHGRRRAVRSGEVLVEQGDRAIPFFVVISGELEAVRPTCATETLITIVRPGQFTGEINTLSGRRALARIRARQDGEVIPERDPNEPPRTALVRRKSSKTETPQVTITGEVFGDRSGRLVASCSSLANE